MINNVEINFFVCLFDSFKPLKNFYVPWTLGLVGTWGVSTQVALESSQQEQTLEG